MPAGAGEEIDDGDGAGVQGRDGPGVDGEVMEEVLVRWAMGVRPVE
jgi:hypothetical protein